MRSDTDTRVSARTRQPTSLLQWYVSILEVLERPQALCPAAGVIALRSRPVLRRVAAFAGNSFESRDIWVPANGLLTRARRDASPTIAPVASHGINHGKCDREGDGWWTDTAPHETPSLGKLP